MAPATDPRPSALIVAHGSPSEPQAQEDALRDLAARVSSHLPGWRIEGTTLAAPGCFEAACARLGRPVVLPFFLAAGWFTGRVLPRRIAALGGLPQLAPFGLEPSLPRIAAARIAPLLGSDRSELLIAAHGSQRSRGSAEATRRFAADLDKLLDLPGLRIGFLEEAPFVRDVAKDMAPGSVCLSLFALNSGHVTGDMPDELAQAGFSGPVLPPLIDWSETPALMAEILTRYDQPCLETGT